MNIVLKWTRFALLLVMVSFLSCKKDKMIPPTIDFKTGTGYVSADSHVSMNSSFTVGIDAKRTEEEDDLKTFLVSVSYDGGADNQLFDDQISSSDAGEFMKDYTLTTRNVAGTEKYSFTVTNRDGLITTKTITITVP